MWDLYLKQNDEEGMNRVILDQHHELIDEKILKYLYDVEEGLNPNSTATLESMSPSTRQLFEVIKS
jgi:hypothetical protein